MNPTGAGHRSRYEAVLFDFDGVLADSEPLHYACWREILAEKGIRLDWETYQRFCIGRHDRHMVEFFCSLKHPPAAFEELWAEYERKRRLFAARVAATPPIPPETAELVKSLHPLKLAVVTSSDRTEVVPVLAAAGLLSRFDVLVCGDDVSHPKPAPDPYLRARQALGIERGLAVEDSEAGVASAKAAGLDVVQVTSAQETARRVREALNRTEL
ncbi:MAG: HAD family phosphatase [Bryobacterales bacterium]|nr:HAD family phosphatase [Bryobacteraceae bacterium]MDW8353623.1 HAD family phosphatase [Bryobacterales bacterium]